MTPSTGMLAAMVVVVLVVGTVQDQGELGGNRYMAFLRAEGPSHHVISANLIIHMQCNADNGTGVSIIRYSLANSIFLELFADFLA